MAFDLTKIVSEKPLLKNYKIDDIVFEKGYIKNEGPFTCTGKCCISAAWIDLVEKERILKYKDVIITLMDDSQIKNPDEWFENEITEDVDFETGKCIGMQVYNNKCNFQNMNKYCVLQMASEKIGEHRWHIKPFYCILYPLVIDDGSLTFDDEHMGGTEECCAITEDCDVPLFKACKEEVEYLFGEDSYKILENQYNLIQDLKIKNY